MPCAVCSQTNESTKNLYNDCIIESLDKIKAHYIHFKSQLDDKYREITRLQLRNDELTRNLASLKSSPKRRKTSSFDDSPSLSGRSECDSLNEAIRLDPSFDESFFIATQKTQPDADSGTPHNVLRVSNNSSENCTPPSATSVLQSSLVRGVGGKGLLPQRLKVNPRKSNHQNTCRASSGVENRSPKWSAKEDIKNTDSKSAGLGLVKREWNMSFMRAPAKCKGSPKTSPTKTLLSLKKEANLKQTRLKFETSRIDDKEETIVQETDETFCGDLVAASPTTVTSASHYETLKSRTGRKFNRPKISSLSDTANKDQSAKVNNIKAEPPSQAKKPLRLLTSRTPPKSSAETKLSKDPNSTSVSGIEPHSDESVCILPSQEQDVIFVEESNANVNVNIDSDTLFDAMMVKSDETSDFLRKIEEKCIENVKNEQGKQNEIGTTTSGNISPGVLSRVNERKPVLPLNSKSKFNLTRQSKEPNTTTIESCNKQTKIIPKWNCKECAGYYTVAGRNMNDEELQKRIKHCLEKHRPSLCETPEGFWNPCFPATPEDDPRYWTLIESKPVEKKKSSI